MKFLRTVMLLTFSITFSIAWNPEAVAAAPIAIKKDIVLTNNVVNSDKKLLDATVNLYCRIKVGNKEISSTGSGVLIDSRGIILTNAHVAQYFLLNGKDSKLTADCKVRTGSPAQTNYKAEVLYISKNWLMEKTGKSAEESAKSTGENDFALLYITEAEKGQLPAQFPTLILGTIAQMKEGDTVTVAGYPAGDLNFREVRNNLKVQSASTTISAMKAFQFKAADLISLSPTKLASFGVSGGPVVSSSTVIGLATTMSTSKKKTGATLRAITVPYIDRIIRSEAGVSLVSLYNTDLAVRTATTRAGLTTKMLSAIEKPLRVTR